MLHPQRFPICGPAQSSREGFSSLLAARPMRRFSGILPLHGPAHKKSRIPALTAELPLFLSAHLSMYQHVFNKDPIPSGRILHQHMCNGSDQFAVLNDWASAHPLNDPSCGHK